MFAFVLPLRAILFQLLCLSVAIALEAYIFQKQWKLSRQTSIQYSISLNLFSTVLGWILFFVIQPLLSVNLKRQLLNYVFFNHLIDPTKAPVPLAFGETALIVFLSFVVILIGELIFLEVLRNLLKTETEENQQEKADASYRYGSTSSFYRRYRESALERVNSTTILTANALSGSAILLILLLKDLAGLR
jgi:uncharacterized membrane protein